MSFLSRFFILFIFTSASLVYVRASTSSPVRVIARSKYTTAHSLGSDYSFDPAEGWQSVNASSLFYKPTWSLLETRSDKRKNSKSKAKTKSPTIKTKPNKTKSKPLSKSSKTKGSNFGVVGVIQDIASDVWKGLKGLGKKEDVTITWYTGEDLKHPSCWSNTHWAPTDKSFAAALTIDGWENKPECFRFLELCNGPEKCIFARVVDTCAGCKHKHVDLTRAAFGALANFDQGILTAQLRLATEPNNWYEDLWGPKA